jgi:hypothetical protein
MIQAPVLVSIVMFCKVQPPKNYYDGLKVILKIILRLFCMSHQILYATVNSRP